jgi:hypothetical protein
MTCISKTPEYLLIPTQLLSIDLLILWNLQTLLPLPLNLPSNSLIGVDVLIGVFLDQESHDLSENNDTTHEYCCCRESGDVPRSIGFGP